jgi:hypothetical protein
MNLIPQPLEAMARRPRAVCTPSNAPPEMPVFPRSIISHLSHLGALWDECGRLTQLTYIRLMDTISVLTGSSGNPNAGRLQVLRKPRPDRICLGPGEVAGELKVIAYI